MWEHVDSMRPMDGSAEVHLRHAEDLQLAEARHPCEIRRVGAMCHIVELKDDQVREVAEVGRNPTSEIGVGEVEMRQPPEGADEFRDGFAAEVVE